MIGPSAAKLAQSCLMLDQGVSVSFEIVPFATISCAHGKRGLPFQRFNDLTPLMYHTPWLRLAALRSIRVKDLSADW